MSGTVPSSVLNEDARKASQESLAQVLAGLALRTTSLAPSLDNLDEQKVLAGTPTQVKKGSLFDLASALYWEQFVPPFGGQKSIMNRETVLQETPWEFLDATPCSCPMAQAPNCSSWYFT